jgi:hypothetical protein
MVGNMPKKSGTKFMMAFVQEYLDGEMDRLGFDLDFIHYLIKHYPKMEREDSDLAECFNIYLAEQGYDLAQGLTDAQHKKLIRKQYNEFLSAMQDGFL